VLAANAVMAFAMFALTLGLAALVTSAEREQANALAAQAAE